MGRRIRHAGWINEKGEKVNTLTEHEKYLLRKEHEKSEDKRMKVRAGSHTLNPQT